MGFQQVSEGYYWTRRDEEEPKYSSALFCSAVKLMESVPFF
jgi:hypothetical protein